MIKNQTTFFSAFQIHLILEAIFGDVLSCKTICRNSRTKNGTDLKCDSVKKVGSDVLRVILVTEKILTVISTNLALMWH